MAGRSGSSWHLALNYRREHPCYTRDHACWMLLRAWPHPASCRHPACPTDTEKQGKVQAGILGGLVGSFGPDPQQVPGKMLAAVRTARLSS